MDKSIRCPYCNHLLPDDAGSGGRCMFCHRPLGFDLGMKIRERKKEKAVDTQKGGLSWTKHVLLSQMKKDYHVTDGEFQEEYDVLKKKWGKDPHVQDVVWSLMNKKLERTSDNKAASILCFRMARFLHEEKKDYSDFLRLHHKYRLTELQREGEISHVKIITGGCETCGENPDEIVPLEVALSSQPLPKAGVHLRGWCTCFYAPATAPSKQESEKN